MATAVLRVVIDTDANGAIAGMRAVGDAVKDTARQAAAAGDAQETAAKSSASAWEGAGRSIGGVARSVGSAVASTARVVAAAWTGAAAAGAAVAVSVFRTGAEFNILSQTATASFKTILGSAKAASQMMATLTKFAKTSPFPREAFISATQQMLAFGIAAKDVVPILDAVQNAVAAAGGGAQEIGEITNILGEIQTSGKITAADLNQLGARGINAAQLIGGEMGKTTAEIQKMISKGALPAGTAISALTAGMAQMFAGAAAGVKETWVGATDRVKGALRDIGAALAAPFIAPAGGGLGVEWANALADVLRALQPIIVGVLGALQGKFGDALGAITPMLTGFTDMLKGIDVSAFADTLVGFLPALGTLTGAFAAMSGGLFASIPVIGPMLASLAGPIGIIVAALAGLIATTPSLQTLFADVLGRAMSVLEPLLPVLSDAFGTISHALSLVVRALAPLIPMFAGIFTETIQALVPILPVVGQAIAVLARAFAGIVKAIAPVIPIVADLVAQLIGSLLPPIITLVEALMPSLMLIVQAVAPFIGQLAAAVMLLIPPIIQIVQAVMPPFLAIFNALIPAILPLLPILGDLITMIVNVAITAIMPLLPPLLELLDALLPLIDPIARIILIFGKLVEALSPIIEIIAELAGIIVGALAGALGDLLEGTLDLLVPMLDKVADAFEWITEKIQDFSDWLKKIKVPEWLKSAGDWVGNLFSAPAGATFVGPTFVGGNALGVTHLGAPAPAPRASSSAPVINVTVNAPLGGGDAIGRAIRDELVRLNRRRGGIILGGPAAALGGR